MKTFSIATKINLLIISCITVITSAIIIIVNHQIEKTMLQTMEASIKNVHKQTTEMTTIAETAATDSIKAAAISDQELAETEEITTSAKSLEQASEGLQLLINRFRF